MRGTVQRLGSAAYTTCMYPSCGELLSCSELLPCVSALQASSKALYVCITMYKLNCQLQADASMLQSQIGGFHLLRR